MRIEMFMKPGCKPVKATYTQAAGYRIDKVKWKFIVYREDGSEYRFTHNFDDVARLIIDGREIPQCYWYDHEIGRNQVREFVKDEIVKVLTDMKDVEIIKDAMNNLYGVKMTDDEIRYCEADIAFGLDAYKKSKKLLNSIYGGGFTFDIYKTKEEQSMKMNKTIQSLISCIEHEHLGDSNVLFILFKDGTHKYYDLSDLRVKIGKESIGFYIDDAFLICCLDKIMYSDIEDWAVGVKNPGESALSAIPNWFEDRINEFVDKLKDDWSLYYTKNLNGDDTILIAQKLDDAIALCKERNFDLPVYMIEADSKDKYFKASDNGCSILTVTEGMDGTPYVTTKKYASEIKKVKENNAMKNYIWNLYYARTKSGQDRIIIARTLDDATRYAETRYECCSAPVWLCEADEHDKYARCSEFGASTLWTTYKGNDYIGDKVAISGVEKYIDAIAYIKHKLGIGITPTGSIEVRYEDGHKTVFDNVEKYEERCSTLGIKNLYIRESKGGQRIIPLTWVKEYVVDMPNDKKVVKEKITVKKEELEDIIAKMRELEEQIKKIKEG